MKRQTHPLHSS